MTKKEATPKKTSSVSKKTTKTTKKKQAQQNADPTQEEITKGIENVLTSLFEMLGKASKWTIIAILAIILLIVGIGYYTLYRVTDASASIEID